MATLTGFKDHLQTLDEWRHYIAQLDARIGAKRAEIARLKAEGRRRDALALMTSDLIEEHRERAIYELKRLLGE